MRGGPGSGKTTLGLQIMSSYLASDDCRRMGKKPAAIFLSLELEPNKVIDKVKRDFSFFKEREDLIETFQPDRLKWIIRKLGWKFGPLKLGPLVSAIISLFLWLKIYWGIHIVAVPLSQKIFEWVRFFVINPSKVRWHERKSEDRTDFEGILFIDSINALLAMVQQYTKLDERESRLALTSALDSVRKIFSRFVIIISSEFHHETSWVPTGMSESFVSDVEILLANEPIAVPVGYETSRQGSAGYNILKIIEKVKGEEGTKLESRSFIRVLKSRKGANQSRRCAYDIVSGVGVQFYETYPGDGHILLFSENPKQKQVWDTFFKEDLPQLYPSLRYEDFDRSSLQRTFLNQRRSRYVPTRTDMYVSSFDNYWINWYGELCWRRAVVETVEQQIQTSKEKQPIVAKLISAIHRSLMGEAKPLLKGLPDIEKNDLISDEVLIAFAAVFRNERCRKCFLCRSSWWVLKRMVHENLPACRRAFTSILMEKKQTNSIKHEQDAFDTPQTLTTVPPEEIVNIFRKMMDSTRDPTIDYCKSSPIRRFCMKFGKAQEGTDLKSLIKQLEMTAYGKPDDADDMFDEKAAKIRTILETDIGNRASELSKKIDELRWLIRSDDTRERLEKDLWNCTGYAKGDRLESEIRRILGEYLEEAEGCECKVEFRYYLKDTLTKKIEAIKAELKVKKDLNQEKMGLKQQKENLKKEKKDSEQEIKDLEQEIEKLEEMYKLLLSQSYKIINKMFDALPPMLLTTQDDEPVKTELIIDLWEECTAQAPYYALYNLMITYHEILRKRNSYHFLSEIPDEKIRLFGERRSRIIKELEKHSPENKRPIHRPGLLFSLRGTKSLVSIPYNANIGFMVYRHDILQKFIKEHIWENDGPKEDFDKYVSRVSDLYKDQRRIIGPILPKESQLPEIKKDEIEKLIKGNIKEYVKDLTKNQRSLKGPLQTWEELIVLLQLMNGEVQYEGKDEDKPQYRHFVIETQTLDSLLCTILELLWNCGGDLKIRPDYSIENENVTIGKLFQALYLLATMLYKGIIPDDSTLDVTHFANKYSKPQGAQPYEKPDDWVFARQWYSTLVDLLTAKAQLCSQDSDTTAQSVEPLFLWQNPDAELGIMPIPISLSYYLERHASGEEAHHISCWGDWHLIMTRGTENTELGIDLINSLMASQKVCERAFQCAAVPTVEEFYTMYKKSRCLSLPERRYDTPKMLPDTTFGDLRKTYFGDARSRSQIFDYEHCMLELQSLFRVIKILSASDRPDWSEMKKEIEDALGRIKALGTKEMLMV